MTRRLVISHRMKTRRQVRRPAQCGFESLEGRVMRTSMSSAFAQFADLPLSDRNPAVVAIRVHPGDFVLPGGGAILGFVVRPAQNSGVDPRAPAVIAEQDATLRVMVRQDDTALGSESLILARVGAGQYSIAWRGARGSTGPSRLDVFLAGDTNNDFRVDGRDIELIRDRAGTRLGAARYLVAADVNRDGVITADDLRLARRNLGSATTVRPIPLIASLAPPSDPDGNGVVLRDQVRFVGQSAPGATARVTHHNQTDIEPLAPQDRRGDVRRGRFPKPGTTTADTAGRFELTAQLVPGLNSLTIEAADRFGQLAQVQRTVRYGDVILDWNASMLNVIRDWTTLSNDPYPNRIVTERPPVAARNLAMVHTAMFDAVNLIEQAYESYLANLPGRPEAPVSAIAAAAAAAHRVASNLYNEPDELAVFDAALAESLAIVPDGPAELAGLALGRQVADAMLEARRHDGAATTVPYTPGNEPGDWNRTFPDFLPPLIPHWPQVTPFAMTSGSQFRPAAPPALDSAEYAAALEEVRTLGRFAGSTRTADQTEIALFWADGGGTFTPPGHWNQIAADVSLERGMSLVDRSRILALLNIALADAGIASWDAKYVYDLWRPIDAIRRAGGDGNDLTAADPAWTPLLKTPPFPAYTSGHSAFSGAADSVLSVVFGPDTAFVSQADGHHGFTQRPLAESQRAMRSFASFAAAADEAGLSRIYGGIHFAFDNTAGLDSGRAIGSYVVSQFLRPRQDVT